ncbi:uncharacterized protein LOC129717821 [Wyeomyia smithii]|uniref:uncharacterized protein LOC129717821 n=1 Tax=Wyeomyia smithii TaxID=174621 RepID=UPI002468159F|nr:uncharacterized protein LOC129717821 [Wyeomyia smithii]
MASKRHDNGAVDAPPKKKKSSKFDTMVKELSQANFSKALLTEELAKAQETIRSLQASLSTARSEIEEVNSVEFENDLGPSSTKHHSKHQNDSTGDLSRFVSSMNQMSVASVSEPECKPSVEGEDISKLDFESWLDLLMNSLLLAGITDEATQQIVFKVKAGQKLLEIYRSTESPGDAPNQETHPFSNAMFRLKKYFASISDVMLQRRRLTLMSQKPDESDLAFIRRVGIAANQCEYSEGKRFEKILNTVAKQANHKEVRIAALKMMSRKASLADLIDKVREIETIRLNEEYVAKKQAISATTVASINAVRTATGPLQYGANRSGCIVKSFTQRNSFRGTRGQRPFRGGNAWRRSNSQIPERCTRCNSVYHSAERCFAIEMTCHNCGGKGHLARACTLPLAAGANWQTNYRKTDDNSLEVAVIGA